MYITYIFSLSLLLLCKWIAALGLGEPLRFTLRRSPLHDTLEPGPWVWGIPAIQWNQESVQLLNTSFRGNQQWPLRLRITSNDRIANSQEGATEHSAGREWFQRFGSNGGIQGFLSGKGRLPITFGNESAEKEQRIRRNKNGSPHSRGFHFLEISRSSTRTVAEFNALPEAVS